MAGSESNFLIIAAKAVAEASATVEILSSQNLKNIWRNSFWTVANG